MSRLWKLLAVGLMSLSVSGCASAAKNECSLEVGGEVRSFSKVYAVRAHDPYDLDDATRLTRVLCLDVTIPEDKFASEGALMSFFMKEASHGVVTEIRDNHEVVTVAAKWAEASSHQGAPFGGFDSVRFEGQVSDTAVTGSVTSTEPLEDLNSDMSVRVQMMIEHEVDATW